MSKLTKDEIVMIKYFAEEKGDPTRWVGWERCAPLVQREFPGFYKAWCDLKAAQEIFDTMAKALPDMES